MKIFIEQCLSTRSINSCPSARYACSGHSTPRVVEARGKAEGADHERSSEPARNGVEWWVEKDSNLRRHMPTDLQSVPVDRFGIHPDI